MDTSNPAPDSDVYVTSSASADAGLEAAASISATADMCSLKSTIELQSVTNEASHKLLTMISTTAPAAKSEVSRPAIDIIPVVDRSGSMHGKKMKLVKETLRLLIARSGLKSTDRMGLVSFDHAVKEELPLISMDAQGRARANSVVDAIEVGGTTNLSGGLMQAIDSLNQAAGAASTGRTRVVLLFTDGLANEGIRDSATLVSAVKGAVGSTAMTLFTFGFGDDHAEDMLRSIAEPSSGLYYFISAVEDIPAAFADCLGGVMSVVAQNASLTLEPASNHQIGQILGSYNASSIETAAGTTAMKVELGDLYAEDEKDLLVEMLLPAISAPIEAAQAIVRAKLRYFSVASSRMEEVSTEVLVRRPSTTPSDQPVNVKLDEQRNRMRAAEAMEEAARLADAGDLEAGRALLQSTKSIVSSSVSYASPLSATLMRDCDLLTDQFADVTSYRSLGRKTSTMSAHSHRRQRGNHTSDAYRAGSSAKASMKTSWGLPESSKAISKILPPPGLLVPKAAASASSEVAQPATDEPATPEAVLEPVA